MNMAQKVATAASPTDLTSSEADIESRQNDVIEQRVVRKQDRHLMSLLIAVYLLSFLDRSNIG